MFDLLDGPVRDLMVALFDAIGYVGIAVIVAIESVVVPIPSELVLPFAGFLVAVPEAIEPLTGAGWSYPLVVLAGTVGSVVGALVAYAIGYWGGRPFLLRFGRYVLISPADVDRAETFFRRHGGKASLLGRLVPVVRSLVSYTAGVARMPLLPFIAYTAVGSAIWVAFLAGAGALVGERWAEIEALIKPVERVVLVGLVIAVAAFAWVRLRGVPGPVEGLVRLATARRRPVEVLVEIDDRA